MTDALFFTPFVLDPSLPARERILLAAHELFYRDGLRATGVDRVLSLIHI